MGAYYNEIDPFCVEWLGNLERAGHIAGGRVDERDIRAVRSEDLAGATQCHFFAGVGVWSYALRLAGWPDDLLVWTGSCPCQPWSVAGDRRGTADERHLWPIWFDLIRQCRPDVIFGEQVSSPDGLKWLDLVCADLESAGYAVGALDTCAAGVGAPHIRQRLYFVAYAPIERHERSRPAWDGRVGSTDGGSIGRLGHTDVAGLQGRGERRDLSDQRAAWAASVAGIWRDDVEWIVCRDGKRRPAKSGTFPLAYGAPARMVITCTVCKTETLIDEDLLFLRKIAGRNAERNATKILFAGMHGAGSDGGCAQILGRRTLSGAALRDGDLLRAVWGAIESRSTSPRSDGDEQQLLEHRGALFDLPREGTCEAAEGIDVRGLWQIIRRAIEIQPKQDLFCSVCAGVGPHLCLSAVAPRVGTLRAYGNAIVAPQATAFIRAVMDVLGVRGRSPA